jgi:hypothetical protein
MLALRTRQSTDWRSRRQASSSQERHKREQNLKSNFARQAGPQTSAKAFLIKSAKVSPDTPEQHPHVKPVS